MVRLFGALARINVSVDMIVAIAARPD